MHLMKEFKSAGLISKKLSERVVMGTEAQAGGAPAAINPTVPQTDVNISGHSTAANPIADQTPTPQNPAAAAPGKTQKDYLMQACKSALGAVESCMESICEGKCFETAAFDQNAVTEMQGMYNMVKEWKAKMETWSQPAAATPPAAQQQQPTPPAQPAQQPQQTASVPPAPSPITGSAA